MDESKSFQLTEFQCLLLVFIGVGITNFILKELFDDESYLQNLFKQVDKKIYG